MPDVILFRTPTPTDTYPALLSAAGYSSTSVAALTDEISTAQLAPILVTGARQWEGAIVTSRRAADAWVRAVGGIEEQRGSGVLVGSTGAPVSDGGSAFALNVYSPGPAVAGVLSELDARWRPEPVTAVSASALAPIILSTPPRNGTRTSYGPYLMLVGDKTLPLLPVALEGAGRTVTKVKVYATAEAPGLAAAVAGLAGMEACAWGVLFSPSSSGYVLRHLEERGWRVRSAGGDSEDRREIRLVAIGETTAGFLRENGFRCDAVASTPDAPGVVEAICGADGRSLPVE